MNKTRKQKGNLLLKCFVTVFAGGVAVGKGFQGMDGKAERGKGSSFVSLVDKFEWLFCTVCIFLKATHLAHSAGSLSRFTFVFFFALIVLPPFSHCTRVLQSNYYYCCNIAKHSVESLTWDELKLLEPRQGLCRFPESRRRKVRHCFLSPQQVFEVCTEAEITSKSAVHKALCFIWVSGSRNTFRISFRIERASVTTSVTGNKHAYWILPESTACYDAVFNSKSWFSQKCEV